MVQRLQMMIRRLPAVLAVVLLLAVAPPFHPPRAMPAAEAEHQELRSPEVSDRHGQIHDVGSPEADLPGHSHGHDPADHSHETAVPLNRIAGWPPEATATPWPPCLRLAGPLAVTEIERPPKPIASI
jgi:hypothetical protein